MKPEVHFTSQPPIFIWYCSDVYCPIVTRKVHVSYFLSNTPDLLQTLSITHIRSCISQRSHTFRTFTSTTARIQKQQSHLQPRNHAIMYPIVIVMALCGYFAVSLAGESTKEADRLLFLAAVFFTPVSFPLVHIDSISNKSSACLRDHSRCSSANLLLRDGE